MEILKGLPVANAINEKLIEEVKLYPNIDNTDGFYIALLERT